MDWLQATMKLLPWIQGMGLYGKHRVEKEGLIEREREREIFFLFGFGKLNFVGVGFGGGL